MLNLLLLLTTLLLSALPGVGSGGTAADSSAQAGAARATSQPSSARVSRETIQKAQQKLIDMGMLKSKATGHMNPATRAAIRAFQKKNGIKATGTLTAETLHTMGISADSTAHK